MPAKSGRSPEVHTVKVFNNNDITKRRVTILRPRKLHASARFLAWLILPP
jgi:hypothetical protein